MPNQFNCSSGDDKFSSKSYRIYPQIAFSLLTFGLELLKIILISKSELIQRLKSPDIAAVNSTSNR
jgi:hypothetical protein